jgi:hypothetical protein
MEKWVKEGVFPDGSKGVPNSDKLELQGEVVLEAQDDYERKQIDWINTFRQWVDWRSSSADPYAKYDYYRSPRSKHEDEIRWVADQQTDLLNYENLIAARIPPEGVSPSMRRWGRGEGS